MLFSLSSEIALELINLRIELSFLVVSFFTLSLEE